MGSTQPMWTYVMGWVGLNFFLTHHGGLGQKSPQPDPCTPLGEGIPPPPAPFFSFVIF